MRRSTSSRVGRALTVDQQAPAHRFFLFDFLTGLPEEEVWTDRRAEDRDQRRPRGMAAGPGRHECRTQDFGPVRLGDECGDHVREQREREPLQRVGDLVIAQAHRRVADAETEQRFVDLRRTAAEHLRRVAHAGEIGRDVDRVGDQQRQREQRDQPAWKFLAQRAGEADSGDHADARAHHLHAAHQRPCQESRPQHAGAELRTCDRIRRDAGWIVIRGARRDAGPERMQDAPQHGWRLLRSSSGHDVLTVWHTACAIFRIWVEAPQPARMLASGRGLAQCGRPRTTDASDSIESHVAKCAHVRLRARSQLNLASAVWFPNRTRSRRSHRKDRTRPHRCRAGRRECVDIPGHADPPSRPTRCCRSR